MSFYLIWCWPTWGWPCPWCLGFSNGNRIFIKIKWNKNYQKKALKNRENIKTVDSNRLSTTYTVTLRKYNKSLGPKILNLNQKWRKKYETQTTKLWNVFTTRNIFTYVSMSFVHLSRFNDGIILPRVCSNRNEYKTKPFILTEPGLGLPNPIVFKQLHHLPYVDAHHPSDNWRSLDPDYKKMQHRWKNWSDE